MWVGGGQGPGWRYEVRLPEWATQLMTAAQIEEIAPATAKGLVGAAEEDAEAMAAAAAASGRRYDDAEAAED